MQELVVRCSKVKAVGTRHSFNNIADTDHDQISLEHLNRIISCCDDTVTIEGGVAYGALCSYLAKRGRALHNLASLSHITVVGACATATHGSGVGNGNLATAVVSLEIVRGDGSLLSLCKKDKEFDGTVVNLGALGVVTKLTLRTSPAFQISQRVYERLPFRELLEHLDEFLSHAYSVSLFTDWTGDSINQVWIKALEENGPLSSFFGAEPARTNLHPIGDLSPENCTPQMGEPGMWHDRLPHFRLEHTPSSGEELQSEYLIPRPNARAAIEEVHDLRSLIAPLLQVSEIRTVAADSLWMSPCYRQDCLAIHFTWKKDWPSVSALLPLLEARLAPLGAKPHWGKLFMDSRSSTYPRLQDFKELLNRHDPNGKFQNAFLEANISSAL